MTVHLVNFEGYDTKFGIGGPALINTYLNVLCDRASF